ncbi:putative coiled-coil protein [Gregarina niphandrodes]|uniref:Coiled-coil protein n=1 Tax=Gregarina niphandrodes TaxID=110365 RepID=A0A023B435_GRENI|nr:putative coiled-coil protein [Gregarina niphandrodes]EZG56354.1 putative coiled-coil protein [Gregarina niphandrodes]|eukprot:XP_011131283.1 putative coiled-coil protein [Gregarina niphandrodes]
MFVFESQLPEGKDLCIFMGDDKFENELLIAHGFPEDIWFHADDYSSAHVYVRLPKGKTIDDLSEEMVNELCQLTKGNSIEGSKQPSIDVVYTPWSNLKKEKGMDIGTIGFHNRRKVIKVRGVNRDRELLRKLEKTRKHVVKTEEEYIQERRGRDRSEIEEGKKAKKQEALAKKKAEEEDRTAYRLKHYVDLKVVRKDPFADAEEADGTIEGCRAAEDDFM